MYDVYQQKTRVILRIIQNYSVTKICYNYNFLYPYSLQNTLTLRQLAGKTLRKLKGHQYKSPKIDEMGVI